MDESISIRHPAKRFFTFRSSRFAYTDKRCSLLCSGAWPVRHSQDRTIAGAQHRRACRSYKRDDVDRRLDLQKFEQSVLHFLYHPALANEQQPGEREELASLVANIKQLHEVNALDARLEIASKWRGVVSKLKLSSAGKEGRSTLTGSLIRRDQRGRFFTSRL